MSLNVSFDFNNVTSQMKPLHGVNNSPTALRGPVKTFTDAGIPYMRTHDSMGAFGGTHYIDIPNIFRDFDADENDPASYDFAFTDAYIGNIIKSGTQIFYRLGVTIENSWDIKAYNIYPPKDFHKWARICEHVIRHYNEGWAEGFHHGIEYWEIWNEPENPPMWRGTKEQFYEFYSVAANHLKKCFPNLKFGGYAGCGFAYVTGHQKNDFYKSFVTFFDEFLDYISAPETKAPLDFFSWHIYIADPNVIAAHAKYVREKLDEKGFTETEHMLNEWNRMYADVPESYEEMRNHKGASFCAQTFAIMQESSLDKAMYYDAYPARRYCGLYTFPGYRPTKTYYSFYAFNRLYRLGGCVGTKVFGGSQVSAMAATDGEGKAILLANYYDKEQTVELTLEGIGEVQFEQYVIDEDRTYEKLAPVSVGGKIELTIPPYGVMLLEHTK
ncbi:MAG: hypothetical protein IJY39_00495 [Clostridia bacterium]|nr:hypothetical protein [Clostridia bacterium]